MANVITSSRTYKTAANAMKALDKALTSNGLDKNRVRWCIAVHADDPTRFVPTVIGTQYTYLAFQGIMVVA